MTEAKEDESLYIANSTRMYSAVYMKCSSILDGHVTLRFLYRGSSPCLKGHRSGLNSPNPTNIVSSTRTLSVFGQPLTLRCSLYFVLFF